MEEILDMSCRLLLILYISLFSKTNETLQQIAKLSEFADVYDICKGYALWFSLIGIGALVTGYFAVAFWTLASERQIKRIRQKFFESVMRQEIGWFDTHESGELSTRFSE
jgi:ABC-type multidrug transport system fused ATPase/permease subunit